jgi:hypothetical protein
LETFCSNLKYFAKPKAPYEIVYAKALRESCKALDRRGSDVKVQSAQLNATTKPGLERYLQDCETFLGNLTKVMLQAVLGDDNSIENLAFSIQQMPRTPSSFWLSNLKRERFSTLSESWKMAIVEYGLAITRVHRAQRLVEVSDKPLELAEEWRHVGHTNWDPREHPETLLLEAESGIMLREIQEIIAGHMRAPEENLNTVMQLSMGEGKSSTILPVVAATLANGNR